MIRKQTGIVLFIFLILVGFAYYLNDQKNAEEALATPTSGTTYIFDTQLGAPTSIEITSALGEKVKVTRRSDDGTWTVASPIEAEADQDKVETAASQVTSLRISGDVDGNPEIFGLNSPTYVISVEFENGSAHQLEVGDNTPTNRGYYVRLDGERMLITVLSGIDSLTNLVSSPPYLNTPTPSPMPPATPSSETTATPSP